MIYLWIWLALKRWFIMMAPDVGEAHCFLTEPGRAPGSSDGTLWLLPLSFLIWDSCQGADGHGGVGFGVCELEQPVLSLPTGEEKPGPLSSPSPLLCKIVYIPHLAIQGQVRWGQDSRRVREQSVADIQILCIWNLTSDGISVIKSLA